MKRKLFLAVMAAAIIFTACGKKPADKEAVKETETTTQTEVEETSDKTDSEESDTKTDDENTSTENTVEKNSDETDDTATTDVEEKAIKSSLTDIQSSSSSLQKELDNVAKFAKSYESYNEKDVSQTEYDFLSALPVVLWKEESEALWNRYEEKATTDEKESYKRWTNSKNTVIEEQLKDYQNGSIYGMLFNNTDALFYKHRAYFVASLLANKKGETFTLPERELYGSYTDKNGESMLLIQPAMESGYEAFLRLNEDTAFKGTVEKSGGDYFFTSEDGKLSGSLSLQWFGAAFTVSESKTNAFHEGEVYEFPIVY